MGGPDDCRVACVVDVRVEGFTRGVLGIWRSRRAALVSVAKDDRAAKAVFMALGIAEAAGWMMQLWLSRQ